jgi:hypothetical protein
VQQLKQCAKKEDGANKSIMKAKSPHTMTQDTEDTNTSIQHVKF